MILFTPVYILSHRQYISILLKSYIRSITEAALAVLPLGGSADWRLALALPVARARACGVRRAAEGGQVSVSAERTVAECGGCGENVVSHHHHRGVDRSSRGGGKSAGFFFYEFSNLKNDRARIKPPRWFPVGI